MKAETVIDIGGVIVAGSLVGYVATAAIFVTGLVADRVRDPSIMAAFLIAAMIGGLIVGAGWLIADRQRQKGNPRNDRRETRRR